ncbi:MAG: hypothetical protein ACE5HP_04715 [Gemmatimonadota bacterium]
MSRERFGNWGRDLRLAVRSLLRTPGVTLVAVGTLALGLGGSAVIYALLDQVEAAIQALIDSGELTTRRLFLGKGRNDVQLRAHGVSSAGAGARASRGVRHPLRAAAPRRGALPGATP